MLYLRYNSITLNKLNINIDHHLIYLYLILNFDIIYLILIYKRINQYITYIILEYLNKFINKLNIRRKIIQ